MYTVRLEETNFRHSATVTLPIPPFPEMVLVNIEGLQARAKIKTVSYVGGNMDTVICLVEYY